MFLTSFAYDNDVIDITGYTIDSLKDVVHYTLEHGGS